MITKIVSLYTAFVIFIGSFSLLAEPAIPDAVSVDELATVESVIQQKESGNDIYAVYTSGYSKAEKQAAIALQGIVAKQNPCIYLMLSGMDGTYLAEIEKSGKTVHYEHWNFETLLTNFISYIGDAGYVLYRQSDCDEGLNVATNYASVNGWLPVECSVEETVKKCGLTLKLDISNEKYNLNFQKKHWEALKDGFRKGIVIHQKYDTVGLRDFAIEQNAFCFYTDSSDAGNRFLTKVLKWSGKNTAIFGWTEKEKHFVALISKLGCYIAPSDYCYNNSCLAMAKTEIPDVNSDTPVACTDPTKHYVTLVFSDGDNCQWIQNGYGEFKQTLSTYPDVTMTWTLSPFLSEFSPITLKTVYSSANSNQYFIAGPSGISYCNPTCYDAKSLDLMTTRTASVMLKSHQRIVTILDDYELLTDAKFAYRLGYYSRFDNIDGGILFLDPNRYQGGEGKVWFSNDKPFASVRLSLWSNEGTAGATDEWLKEQADIINSYPADINSINGYSVICVHAWTMQADAIKKFVENLDEHIVILNADDFIKSLQTNIPHENAKPEA